ncbi:alkene reductase [Sphingopyxis indica]|uniref:alkene reductase n=1 Tax=Sphingopyxis indica TaxID=436663 RepID=UPI002938D815|nr:alkene reductase [Sphingopyxis indica]WOF43292.1 alkene reductase [Sphingopyxis indica]
MASANDVLFEPLKVGNLNLRNRIVMAPMSRHRSAMSGVPTDLNVEYYRQRASAGLLITEGTSPSPLGQAYLFTPGLHTEEHAAGWRRVADAVHGEGGAIFVQLMHAGRISDTLLLNGEAPVAPSAVAPPLNEPYSSPWPKVKRAYPTPRELSHQDVLKTIDEYRASAVLAQKAGIDGVEIHAAAGYLPMQFLSTNANLRTDEWGGSIERRSAFLLAVVDAIAAATSPGFVSVKVSPGWTFNQVEDTDPVGTYSYLVRELSKRSIAYLHVGNYGMDWDVYGTLRPLFDGPMIVNAGFHRAAAAAMIGAGGADLTAFGQHYIANPDLVERYRNDWDVSRPQLATYYTQGYDGYTDYPVYAESDPATRQGADLPVNPIMPE